MLIFPTKRPNALLKALRTAIEDGDITTWAEDSDGDFSHKATQWRKRAWLRPRVVSEERLEFTIIFTRDESEKRIVYSYYHGHMIETFLNHFYEYLSGNARATPNPAGDDNTI